jgi:hypothetical protein
MARKKAQTSKSPPPKGRGRPPDPFREWVFGLRDALGMFVEATDPDGAAGLAGGDPLGHWKSEPWFCFHFLDRAINPEGHPVGSPEFGMGPRAILTSRGPSYTGDPAFRLACRRVRDLVAAMKLRNPENVRVEALDYPGALPLPMLPADPLVISRDEWLTFRWASGVVARRARWESQAETSPDPNPLDEERKAAIELALRGKRLKTAALMAEAHIGHKPTFLRLMRGLVADVVAVKVGQRGGWTNAKYPPPGPPNKVR